MECKECGACRREQFLVDGLVTVLAAFRITANITGSRGGAAADALTAPLSNIEHLGSMWLRKSAIGIPPCFVNPQWELIPASPPTYSDITHQQN